MTSVWEIIYYWPIVVIHLPTVRIELPIIAAKTAALRMTSTRSDEVSNTSKNSEHRMYMVVSQVRGTFLGVPIIRTIVLWGLYWGPPILGNSHIRIFLRHRFRSLTACPVEEIQRGRTPGETNACLGAFFTILSASMMEFLCFGWTYGKLAKVCSSFGYPACFGVSMK